MQQAAFMKGIKKYYLIFLMLTMLCVFNCKKLINTPALAASNSYLVVTGNIDPGDTTVLVLSRTVNVSGTVNTKPELNAAVTIEGSQSGSFRLTAEGNGNYYSAPVNLSPAQTYRLKIVTSSGEQYASDYVPVKNSPAIDSVNYVVKSDGLQINVNTHDAANTTRYYRWEYNETYVFHTAFQSNYIVLNHDTTGIRPASHEIYQCWHSDTSSNIILASSAKLSQDVISSQSIIKIPAGSEKLNKRYTIFVKQYALTPDAYNYFTLLQKNTEQLGSIFDAQPSELRGNIHSLSNAAEPVIGFVTIGKTSNQRIFVDNNNLPAWTPDNPYAGCTSDTLLYKRIITFPTGGGSVQVEVHDLIYSGVQIPLDKVGDYPSGGFTAAYPQCVDCTLRGTNKQPSFWK